MKYNLKGLTIAAVATVTKTLAGKVAPTRPAPRSRDPWYSDLDRRAEINARATAAGSGWVPRRPGWLRSRGVRW